MKNRWKRTAEKLRAGYLSELKREVIWMFRYIRKYRAYVALYGAVGIVGTVMGLAGSVTFRFLVDAMTGKDQDMILMAAGAIALTGAGSIGLNAVNSLISAKINVVVQNEIQSDIYHKILAADWEEIHDYQSGDLLNRMNGDIGQVSGSIIGWLPGLVVRLLQFAGTLGIILYYDPVMAGITLLTAPVTLAASRVLMRRMRDHNREMREISSTLMSFQSDSFQNLQTVKAFGLMDVFSQRLEKIQGIYQEKVMEYNHFAVYTTSMMAVMGRVAAFICLGWGVYRYIHGYLTLGTVMMFLQMAGMVSASFSSLVQMIPSAVSATTSAGRLMAVSELKKEEVLDKKNVRKLERQKNGGFHVVLEHVDMIYKEGNQVIADGSFRANRGEITAIVGPSGEGKTTLVRLLLGLVYPMKGRAFLEGRDGRTCLISSGTRWMFGYVPQGNTMFSGTIADNLRMGKADASEEEMTEALKTGCAWEFVRRLPEGLGSMVGERGAGLSEGQAQRIAIARAILQDAPVLVLDEATSALDLETEEEVLANLRKKKPNRTCIVVTHRESILPHSDHIYEIQNNCLRKIR